MGRKAKLDVDSLSRFRYIIYIEEIEMTITTLDELLDYWPGNIPFKGQLVSDDGTCMCAQGQALHFLGGMSVDDLRRLTGNQPKVDKLVADLMGISRAHAVLLRNVNDSSPGAPSVVIRNPVAVLGDQAHIVLAFWKHLDRITDKQWDAALDVAPAAWNAARDAAGDAAWTAANDSAGTAAGTAAQDAAWNAARDAARDAAGDDAWNAAQDAAWNAARASNEIQGAAVMRALGQPFFFLPMFGFADPEDVLAADTRNV
jgi:hypothetical protein